MRKYTILTQVLLILSTISFALSAPVTVQVHESHQARNNVVDVPMNDITAPWKRADLVSGLYDQYLEKLWNGYFDRLWGNSHLSSAETRPSEPGRSMPDHTSPRPPPSSSSSEVTSKESTNTIGPMSSISADFLHQPLRALPPDPGFTPADLGTFSKSPDSIHWSTISNAPSAETI